MDPLPTTMELLTRQFYDWERRGRGWSVWKKPVDLEPPFRPFFGHYLTQRPVADDGQFETPLSRLASRFLGRPPAAPPVIPETEAEPEPEYVGGREPLTELQILVPPDLETDTADFEQFLSSVSPCRQSLAFEFIGEPRRISAQFAVHPDDASLLRRQFRAFFPQVALVPVENSLERAWQHADDRETAIVEFGLAHEFMRPLAQVRLDPYVALLGALSELHPDELAVFQVLFTPVQNPWAESVLRAVNDNEGGHFFINAPGLVKEAQRKVSRSLYAAVVRLATRSADFDRAWEIARHLAGALRVFGDPMGNELIPLSNDEYPFAEHETDVLFRQSRRSGMLLNAEELTGFVHLPSTELSTPTLRRLSGKTKPAAPIVERPDGLLLGNNLHAGESKPVRLSPEQRVRHSHLIGASGTGKSTLLFNLIQQDIENGQGIAVLDPHGDLIDRICGVIPDARLDDVILVDPSDPEYSVGFNFLAAHSDLEKNLLASDLVAVFQRLSTSWGDQMNSVLQNAILAFLESDRKGTVADLRRFLIEPQFRNEFLTSVRDAEVVYYWRKSFPHLSGNKSIGSILTRLDTFLAQKPIRHMVSQVENKLDFAHIMDSGKLFLAKLPEGLLGKENSYLLGTLLVSKFQQIAMSRQAQQIEARRDYWIYIDEFANFITPSMAEILSGARKYRIGMTLAHHELHQLERNKEVASAVMSHPFTRIVFRVGDDDARKLAEGFSYFEAKDLRNLEIGQAVCRVERSDFDFNLSVPLPKPVAEDQEIKRRQEVITASRKKYGTPRAEVEGMLAKSRETPAPVQPPIPPPVKPIPEPSKTTQAPKVTVSGKEEAAAVARPTAPRDLGRGGEQHKAIQERIQREAHALGFFAAVEQQLADSSQEAADIVVRKGDLAIAVEISVTTTVDHEFGNVKKCLSAGFARVAVVSPRPERLQAIAKAVNAGLDATQRAKVSYHTPDEFIDELRKLAQQAVPLEPKMPTERTTRGYTVRRRGPDVSAGERRAAEEAAIRLIADTMKHTR